MGEFRSSGQATSARENESGSGATRECADENFRQTSAGHGNEHRSDIFACGDDRGFADASGVRKSNRRHVDSPGYAAAQHQHQRSRDTYPRRDGSRNSDPASNIYAATDRNSDTAIVEHEAKNGGAGISATRDRLDFAISRLVTLAR